MGQTVPALFVVAGAGNSVVVQAGNFLAAGIGAGNCFVAVFVVGDGRRA